MKLKKFRLAFQKKLKRALFRESICVLATHVRHFFILFLCFFSTSLDMHWIDILFFFAENSFYIQSSKKKDGVDDQNTFQILNT